jgi:hypothetical protein
MKRSLSHRLDRIERRERAVPKVRYVITDGSSKEDGEWYGNYFLRRTPLTEDEWIRKHVTPD